MERVHAPIEARDGLIRRLVERFQNIRVWSEVPPGTEPYLESLKAQGYYLGVISNSIGTIEDQLGHLGLGRHLNTVIDSAVVGVEKPHIEIFQIALRRAGVMASEALFVGDIYSTDVGGARRAGLHGVLLDRVGAYDHPDCPRLGAPARTGRGAQDFLEFVTLARASSSRPIDP